MGRRRKPRKTPVDWTRADYKLGHTAIARDEYRRPKAFGMIIERHAGGVIIAQPGSARKYARWDELEPPTGRKWNGYKIEEAEA